MKSVRFLAVLGLISSATTLSLLAQSTQQVLPPAAVEFIVVAREAFYDQTGPTTVTPNAVTPFRFSVGVEGSGFTSSTPLTAVSFTWPSGSATPLAFDTWDSEWEFQNGAFASMAALNSVYGTGTYDVSLTGTPTATVGIVVGSFAGSTLQVPQLTLSGGTWSGNAYVLGETDSLTVTFNSVYSGTPSGTQGFHYDAWITDGFGFGVDGFINYNPMTSSAVPGGATPSAWVVGTLAVGVHNLEVGYSDIQNPAAVLGSAFSASLLEYRTNVQLVVVPEPSTYALFALGLGVVGLARWRRRQV